MSAEPAQLSLALPSVAMPASCGYCLRALARADARPGWSCPRCTPILATLGRGRGWDQMLDDYRAFQREAWSTRQIQEQERG